MTQRRAFTPDIIDRIMEALPPGLPEARRAAFRATLENPPRVRVDRTVADGDKLPMCGGITVIETPGHTPGHICLYHQRSRTQIAGDSLLYQGGKLALPSVWSCHDPAAAVASVRKLASVDVRALICYHGGPLLDRPAERIAELATRPEG